MNTIPVNVLLVDDQPAHLAALESALEGLEAHLVRAESGSEALAALARMDVALVVLDVQMPGMDGFEVARQIRDHPGTHPIPILFITDDGVQRMASAYALGAVDFLTKPVLPEILKAKVSIFVELFRSREDLRANRDERLRLAAEASGLGVWIWEPDIDRVTWEHHWLADMLGIPRREEAPSAERFRNEFIHPDDREEFRDAARDTLRTSVPFYFQGRIYRRSDNALRWIELRGRLQPGSAQRPRQVLGTAMDITERKQFEQRLQANEERYRTLFESIDEGFCLVGIIRDASGKCVDYRFLEANQAFQKHTGLPDPVGRTILEMAPNLEPSWFDIYGEVAATGKSIRFIDEARALGRWFDVHASRLGPRGSDRVAILFSDITAQRRREEDLRRLADELGQANRRKTEFLATLAHELRNPLAPLSNGLQVMRVAAGQPEIVERTRQMMERQIQHMVHLVDDLLDVARISTGKVELRRQRIDLKTVVASAVETSAALIEAGKHRLSMDLPDEPLPLDADPTRLAQVVSNLLNNAAKYTPGGGAISLSARRAGGEVLLQVTDTGIGIPPDAMDKVFEMFAQVPAGPDRPQGGLGIGLSLVRSLVELHGGSVTAASDGPGLGSTFTVRLPLAADAIAGQAAGAGPEPAPGFDGLRILVVDDNADAADSLAFLLQMEGHATRVAHDGQQALALAQAFAPDVVFLDIGLPDLNGYEVARQLRAMPSMQDKLLVALTGWGTQEDRVRSREAGFDHHLTKPAELAAVEKLLQRPQPARPVGGARPLRALPHQKNEP